MKTEPDLLTELNIEISKEAKSTKKAQAQQDQPVNLGKAVKLPVPDFSDPSRPATCLEVDFPIAPINALSKLEGNAGKPIYQMSKWWARRRSSVFRAMLIAAATEAPKPGDKDTADKRVWDHYYANHQKAASFKNLRVLDPFMGGGTTLVEGARLGMKMTGVDLNPVAWFVVKNETACSDPQQVKAFFDRIEEEVKPAVQPYYTTTCPRGHTGRWVDVNTNQPVDVEPLDLPVEDRRRYRWEGPEVIYTFWAKHGPCPAFGCGHRTPVFRTPVIAEKKLSTQWVQTSCPTCHHDFRIEVGETRMAPGAERVVLDSEPSFTELSQGFAKMLSDYNSGAAQEKRQRVTRLLSIIDNEPGCKCPNCGAFAGGRLKTTLEMHARPTARVGDIKKKDFGFEKGPVYMYLLMHPDWLKGSNGTDKEGDPLGGFAGADPQNTQDWVTRRQANLQVVEVRGRIRLTEDPTYQNDVLDEDSEQIDEEADERKGYGLPRFVTLGDGTKLDTTKGTIPARSTFTCSACGRASDLLEAVRETGNTAPTSAYTLQCYCPECDYDGYNYNGRFFKAPDIDDVKKLGKADLEWQKRFKSELHPYWPNLALAPSFMTHRLNGGIPNWGYTHWWKMFNSRQLLAHTQLMWAIESTDPDLWPLDVREQALGAFQQYLRNQNMFCFWDVDYDKLVPFMSNSNYHPKVRVVENSVFGRLGRGNWTSCCNGVVEGLHWSLEPWETVTTLGDNRKENIGDPLLAESSQPICGSSTDLPMPDASTYDLAITDPPFGNNLYYADLAEFFYQWLRLPLRRLYEGKPEASYFEPERTPHAQEAIENPHEHPDDREGWEKELTVTPGILDVLRQMSGDESLQVGDSNPLYRREPAPDFYRRTLEACWTETHRVLKPGGLLVFTFHHKDDAPWVDVLESLFEAGYLLTATYPIRSDEIKGAKAQFGSRKIEYDIIHVCRKCLEEPEPVSWAKMRRYVREEAARLKKLIEGIHGHELPESDLRIILIGKSLEFYSRHYGQVYTGDATVLPVRDALLGINQILEDLQEANAVGLRLPDGVQPLTRHYLRLFGMQQRISKDDLSKSLRGTGYSPDEFMSLGWIRTVGSKVEAVPIEERFSRFTTRGRTRGLIKSDLDISHFLIGAAMPGSKVDIEAELRERRVIPPLASDAIIGWYEMTTEDELTRLAANTAKTLVGNWRTRRGETRGPEQLSLFEALEASA